MTRTGSIFRPWPFTPIPELFEDSVAHEEVAHVGVGLLECRLRIKLAGDGLRQVAADDVFHARVELGAWARNSLGGRVEHTWQERELGHRLLVSEQGHECGWDVELHQ